VHSAPSPLITRGKRQGEQVVHDSKPRHNAKQTALPLHFAQVCTHKTQQAATAAAAEEAEEEQHGPSFILAPRS
jgi:hypothetical protein